MIMDLEMAYDDQMMNAIAMSLAPDLDSAESEEVQRETTVTNSIDEFTKTAVEQCLTLLDLMPDTVYRICDLLFTITKRNGNEWRDNMLRQLVGEVGVPNYYLFI